MNSLGKRLEKLERDTLEREAAEDNRITAIVWRIIDANGELVEIIEEPIPSQRPRCQASGQLDRGAHERN